MTEHVDAALLAADFFESHHRILKDDLIRSFQNGMWHIMSYTRAREDGVVIRDIYHHVGGIMGMDQKTCTKRVRDLFEEGWVSTEDYPLKAGSVITPTPKLISAWDKQHVQLANLLIGLVTGISTSLSVMNDGDQRLTARLEDVLAAVGSKVSVPAMEKLLKSLGHPLGMRRHIMQCLHTYSYSRIITLAWRRRYTGNAHLTVSRIQHDMYEVTERSETATSEYVRTLEQWGFLKRLNKNDGVKGHKYTVSITDQAFDEMTNMYEAAYPLLLRFGRKIADSIPDSSSRENVIPMPRSSQRNV